MKEIKAYIRKEQAEIILRKLEMAGVTGMTVLDANALSQWADQESFSYSIDLVQKYSTVVKIELVCNDDQEDKLVEVIKKYGYTGRSGDGWIFVSGVERAVRVRTGEENVIG
jgi:nitrogen regulatory protein P-II 1